MQTKYYRLNKNLDANKIMHDIQSMIKEHAKLNKIQDTILKIELKDVSYTYEDLERKGINGKGV